MSDLGKPEIESLHVSNKPGNIRAWSWGIFLHQQFHFQGIINLKGGIVLGFSWWMQQEKKNQSADSSKGSWSCWKSLEWDGVKEKYSGFSHRGGVTCSEHSWGVVKWNKKSWNEGWERCGSSTKNGKTALENFAVCSGKVEPWNGCGPIPHCGILGNWVSSPQNSRATL